MDLIEWIQLIRVAKAAEILGVTKATLSQWKMAQTSPQVMMAHKVVELSHGLVDWEGVYKPYVKARLAEQNENQLKLNM